MELASLIPDFGNWGWNILALIVALGVIVSVHEFGHYIVARWCGIGAEVFSLGFGPVLASVHDRHGTRWQVAAIPLGGYVKFVGDVDAASAPDSAVLAGMSPEMRRRSVHGAPLWARALTVAAGPVFNFILSVIVFAAVLFFAGVTRVPVTVAEIAPLPAGISTGLKAGDEILAIEGHPIASRDDLDEVLVKLPDTPTLQYEIRRDGEKMTVTAPTMFPPLVGGVLPQSAADDIGLRPGDVITSVDGQPVATFEDLRTLTGNSDGKPLVLSVWRDGTSTDFTLVPQRRDLPTAGGGFETRWLIGLTGATLFQPGTELPGLIEALTYGAQQTWGVIVTSMSGLYHMVIGAISSCNLSSVIGIAEASGNAASMGALSFVAFVAALSTAVGLLNLFPVPILDGGHLVFYAYEAVTGRPPGDRAMRLLMSIGLVLLIALMVFAVGNDLRCR